MNRIIIIFLFLIANYSLQAQIKIIKPTGSYIDDYVLMKELADTSIEHRRVIKIINESAVKDILSLYNIAQNYLINTGKLDGRAPAYLALTENQGGYAKSGFFLIRKQGDTISQRGTRYVDIKLSNILTNYNRLMSFTQLYPHELGHIIYSMVAWNEYVDPDERNVDMHYFPVITDYSTAFNEGFAELFENISRIIEEDDSIRNGIQRDIERIESSSEQWIDGYIRDFKYSARLGFYKSSMINWFQKYEDYRRYIHALNAEEKYVFTSPELDDIEDRLSIRNAGIMPSDKLKNSVQLMSTEGFVASFFTQMLLSDLPYKYLDKSFYKVFLTDTSQLEIIPDEHFTPMENQMVKIYYVLHNFVSKWNSNKNQFSDFFKGYISSFPDEEHELMNIYKNASGRNFNLEMPDQIWMMVKGHDHRVLAIDPFGAITVPVYTFDLNAAEMEDLLCMPGMNEEMAESVLSARENEGLFRSMDDVKNSTLISKETAGLLEQSQFDKNYMNELEEPELSFSAIINTPLKWLLFKSGVYMMMFIVILNVFFLSARRSGTKKRIWLSMRYALWWWLLFALICGLILMTSNTLLYSFLVLGTAIVISGLIFLKNKNRLRRTFVMTILMSLVLLLSVI